VLRSAVKNNKIDAYRLLIELGSRVNPSAFAQASCMDMIEVLYPHLSQSDILTSRILNYVTKSDFLRDLLIK